MKPLTVLVTGANGFVGATLCEHFHWRGYAVRRAVRGPVKPGASDVDVVAVGPLSAGTDWSSALLGVDVIVHLAARVHVIRDTENNALHAYRNINVGATEGLARAAIANGVKRLVYVSSIKVNGEATFAKPFTAEDPVAPQDAYGVSKYEAECILRTIAESNPLEVTIVRPPLVYGPGVGGNFLRLLKLLRRGIPLPFGAVRNLRSLVYNPNLADALVTCAVHPDAAGKTYLVSDRQDISLPDLLQQLAKGLGRQVSLWAVPPNLLRIAGALTGHADEIDRLVGSLRVDASRVHTELGWTPPFSVEEGLVKTARWYIKATE